MKTIIVKSDKQLAEKLTEIGMIPDPLPRSARVFEIQIPHGETYRFVCRHRKPTPGDLPDPTAKEFK